MSSTMSCLYPPDYYADLVTPWKPVTGTATKNIASTCDRLEVDHGVQDQEKSGTESVGAVYHSHADAQREDAETSDSDSVNTDMIVGDGARYPGTEKSGMEDDDNTNSDNSIGDGAQNDAAEVTDNNNDAPQQIDKKCVAVATCLASSSDHRKVVSHIFGRNKACTRELPEDLWIFWCRKHYQRKKYRAEKQENWHTTQLGLVHEQLDKFEDWGKIHTWTISLRKTEQIALDKENKDGTGYTNHVSSCWERFLVPYLGANKSFAQIRDVLKVIENKFEEAEYKNRDVKHKTFPGVEFLPHVQQVKEAKKPTPKKETGYKKITLDQGVYNRKNQANTDYIKKMAAKKGSPSKTPKSSRSPSASKKLQTPDTDTNASTAIKKRETPATDNHATHHKRKAVDQVPDSENPLAKRRRRRRLTRGFEKHGSEEDSSFLKNEVNEEEEEERKEGCVHEMSREAIIARCLAGRLAE